MIYKLWVFNQHMEAARNSVAQHFDLSGPQYTIFMAIARFEKQSGVNSRTLAALLNVSPPFVATEVKQLLALGLIEKSVDLKDRRKIQLRTSKRGRKLVQANEWLVNKMNDLLFSGLNPTEVRQLISLASKLTLRSERAAAVIDTHYKLSRQKSGSDLAIEHPRTKRSRAISASG